MSLNSSTVQNRQQWRNELLMKNLIKETEKKNQVAALRNQIVANTICCSRNDCEKLKMEQQVADRLLRKVESSQFGNFNFGGSSNFGGSNNFGNSGNAGNTGPSGNSGPNGSSTHNSGSNHSGNCGNNGHNGSSGHNSNSGHSGNSGCPGNFPSSTAQQICTNSAMLSQLCSAYPGSRDCAAQKKDEKGNNIQEPYTPPFCPCMVNGGHLITYCCSRRDCDDSTKVDYAENPMTFGQFKY